VERDKNARVILLVEDNQADVLLTLRAFKKSGMSNEIVVMRDGQEALDYLFGTGPFADRENFVLPAVVLLDLQLPRVSGLDVLRRIRSDPRTYHQPVVILTSSNEDRDVVAGCDSGTNAYVRKPVEFVAFAGAARALGFFWLMVNRLPAK
jgi:two-component system response regulator